MAKIYIIDDEAEMTDSLSMILEAEGHTTACQNNADEAVENIAKFQPDLIILDVMFPNNNSAGFEIARRIRKHREILRDTPILMLSAINDRLFHRGTFSNEDIDEAWLPVDQFIDKPVNPQILINKVRELLSNWEK